MAKIKLKLRLIILHLINVRMSLDYHLTKVLADSHIFLTTGYLGCSIALGGGGGGAKFIHTAQVSNTRTE